MYLKALFFQESNQPSIDFCFLFFSDAVNQNGETKRQRTSYTRYQTLELEKEFHFNRYLTRRRRSGKKQQLYFDVSKQYEFCHQDRDSARSLLDRAADQDLVPKPSDEVEEGAQDGEHERHAHAPDAPRPRLWPPSPPSGSL